MLAASAKFRPAIAWFARQIAPSVLATLIAALVIAGYNRAFSGHLQQPRMAALHAAMDKVTGEPATPAAVATEAAATPKPAWTTQVVEIIAPTGDLEHSFDKDEGREAAKDQSKLKVADVAPAAAPVAPRPVAVRQELPRQEPRQEWREPRVAEPQVIVVDPRGVAPMATPPGGYLAVQQPVVVQPLQPAVAPVVAAPMAAPTVPVAQQPVARVPVAQQPVARAPVAQPPFAQPPFAQPPVAQSPVAQEPPPVITAKPMVTVPDRPGMRPGSEAPAPAQVQPQQAEAPPQQQHPGVLGAIVDTLKPSSILRSAREFGDKIEAAGNDILPNIRQQ
jgi:hypothetical protein